MMMPAIDFAELRRQVRLGQVLDLLGFAPVSRWGAQLRGPCPVHGAARPRSRVFSAHLEHHCWHCFRCGASGNALDLWLAVTHQPIYAGALDLCRRLGLAVPWLPPGAARRGRQPAPRSPPGA
jgi:DNA primase